MTMQDAFMRPEMFGTPLTAVVVVPHHQFDPNLLTQEETNNSSSKRLRRNPAENKLASFDFFSRANEDILLEILVRLPNCRSVIQSSTVCRGWLQLISRPEFMRMRRDRDQHDLCYTILFRREYYHVAEHPEYFQDACKLFSHESLLLHGTSSSTNYFGFMPQLSIIRASCNDLLLMSPDPRGFRATTPPPKLYICNPVTRKWSLIPGGFPLGKLSGSALICDQDGVYKVVIIYSPKRPLTPPPPPHVPDVDLYYRHGVAVFCTKSAQWSVFNFYFPVPERVHGLSYRVVTCNGVLYWIDGYRFLDRILAVDLFNNFSYSGQERGVVIYLPEVIHNHKYDESNDDNVKAHLGAVGGRDMCREDRKRSSFLVKVWELNSSGGNSWVLVHENNVRVPNGDVSNVVSVAFHPNDCDVVFVICGMGVFEYRLSENEWSKLIRLFRSRGNSK